MQVLTYSLSKKDWGRYVGYNMLNISTCYSTIFIIKI